jgi:hypothetical protein
MGEAKGASSSALKGKNLGNPVPLPPDFRSQIQLSSKPPLPRGESAEIHLSF